jgi:hydroxyethylthiazole kinase-like uncharacterized protein yjeF
MNELETPILDCNSRYYGMDAIQLMENAGRSAAEEIEKRYGRDNNIGFFCGPGNNGGDGFVAARFLSQYNEVTVYVIGTPQHIRTEDARKNWHILEHTPVKKVMIRDTTDMLIPDYDIIVDSLLGTGLSGELREPYKTLVKTLNSLSGAKVSVDVPTGYKTSVSFHADVTVSMHYPKTDDCTTVTIGVPAAFESLVGPGDVKFLNKRRKDSHKGDNGRILIVGGSREYHGAPIYAGLAASKVVDLVVVACPASAAHVIKEATPDFIVHPLSSDYLAVKDVPTIVELASACDAVLLGPGLGMQKETQKACCEVLSHIERAVIDADGLKALKGNPHLLSGNTILTPHKGEFEMLFGGDSIEEAARNRCTIIQKGACDIISNGVKTKYNYTGNAGMTTGGTGDILAGLAAGFAACNDVFQAACAAAFVNGMAGDMCFDRYRFHYTASDVVTALQEALSWCDTF